MEQENKTMQCTRCGEALVLFGKEELQLGSAGWLTGNLGNLVSGALPVEIYLCPACRKVELYCQENNPPKKYCGSCGQKISVFARETCPACGKAFPKADAPRRYLRPKNF